MLKPSGIQKHVMDHGTCDEDSRVCHPREEEQATLYLNYYLEWFYFLVLGLTDLAWQNGRSRVGSKASPLVDHAAKSKIAISLKMDDHKKYFYTFI